MNEKPKSIWKRSWAGGRGLFFGWLILMAAFAAIFLIWTVAEKTPLNQSGDELKLFVVAGIGVTVIFLLVISVRWACCRRNFKRFLFGLACFATLIALFYAEEDWRGWHAWNQFKHQWEAKGEKFDWQSIVPPPVPDDQNFAMQPIWVDSIKFEFGTNIAKEWYGETMTESERTNLVDRLGISIYANMYGDEYESLASHAGNWAKGTETDLKSWQQYYRDLASKTNEFPVAPQLQTPAQDVLLALSKYDPAIEELREASKLPYSRFPLNYNSGEPFAILLPHLAALKRCAQVLQLRAIAELQNNESQKALDDVRLMLHLTDASRTEPFLISHLVRIAILQITLQPVYEGLAEHKWSDAQLTVLDSELAKLDFLADYENSMRGERALSIAGIEFLGHPNNDDIGLRRPRFYFFMKTFSLIRMLSNLSGDDSFPINNFQLVALGFGPSGWLRQNELRIAQCETKWYLPVVDENAGVFFPAKVKDAESAFEKERQQHQTPENILEIMFMPSLGRAAEKYAYGQSSADLARVAIALERYRLAHGDYPDSLDALAPQFIEKIPHDVIGGQPLHYRLTNDGQFVLYSVGWNERDDGGVVVTKPVGMNSNRTPIWDISQGDWVWRYPAK